MLDTTTPAALRAGLLQRQVAEILGVSRWTLPGLGGQRLRPAARPRRQPAAL